MASPSNPIPDPLAEALRENQQLRSLLAQLQAEAPSANQQLQEFLYAASHDLQEPLRGIVTYAQLLDRQFVSDPMAQEYASFILAGAVRMRGLLQDVLVYSRAGSSKQHKMINLNVPLQMALLKLAPEIQASSARVVKEPLPEAIADEAEIAHVFEQIIANALKFRSQAAPEIAIAAEQGTDECTVTVRDNGVGIDPRFCEQVMLPFKRLHDKRIPGSGLGLAICRKILRAHQGRIWMESDGTHGSAVYFTLPL
jgi:light-regulated signal transduction histidine kinase (bacteriophytochrome)